MSHHFAVVFDISDEDYCSRKTILMELLESPQLNPISESEKKDAFLQRLCYFCLWQSK